MTQVELSRRALARPLLLVAFLSTACGSLFDYPEIREERDAVLCRNGTDDDLDGKTDCQDPDCNGVCTEESAAECGDQRDNDGDGLVDAADPRCWLAYPPSAKHCARAAGAEIEHHFDVAPVLGGGAENQSRAWSEWAFYGYDGVTPVVGYAPHAGPERRDLLVRFQGNTTGSQVIDSNLGSYVRQVPFSGSWQDFELSFDAFVPQGAVLRAGIVPMTRAPSGSAPLDGAETALFSVSLDASRSPSILALDVEGLHSETELMPDDPACDGTSRDCMGKLTVGVDEEGFRAVFVDSVGHAAEVRHRAPSSLSLEPSRVLFWGGSAKGAPGAELDDLHLRIQPELPCGFPVPQMPKAGACEGAPASALGYSVSVARGSDGQYCALVAGSFWDDAAQRLGAPTTGALGVWQSLDGDEWGSVGAIPWPVEGPLTGASIAADSEGFHAVVAVRDEAEGSVQLVFADAPHCSGWGAATLGPFLAADVEAPSYLVTGSEHEVYFTRPAVGDARRTLWRILRSQPDAEPELIGDLPLGVEAPVALQHVGLRDVVLASPSRAGSEGRGVTLFVANDALTDWQQVGTGPVLSLPPSIDLPVGVGRLSFDDREVLSAALFADDQHGFLLYGGRTTEGGFGTGELGTPSLSAGTARLLKAGDSASPSALVPEATCGDGTCASDEDCVRCPADCPCAGVGLLAGALDEGQAWTLVSSEPNAESRQYVGANPPALGFAGGAATWSALALEHALTGDFELSFDVLMEGNDGRGGGLVYVGIGTEPFAEPAGPEDPAPSAGIFAKISGCSPWTFSQAPSAVLEGTPFVAPETCFGAQEQYQGLVQHVTLRREGSNVSLFTPDHSWLVHARDRSTCSTSETSVRYPGAMPALTHLLVGSGGMAFGDAPAQGNPGTITNLELRLLDDPKDCAESKTACGGGSEQLACVDTRASAEHCGACGHRCEGRESCEAGLCSCLEVAGTLECGGECVDGQTSLENCGQCGNACSEQCVNGRCDPIFAGDCASPFEIPADGGNLLVGFPAEHEPATLSCDGYADFVNELIGSFTPSKSGTAVIEIDVGEQDLNAPVLMDSVVAITDDPSCGEWLACNDDIETLKQIGSRLTIPVEAGRTYRVAVALWDYRPPGVQTVDMHVGFEP